MPWIVPHSENSLELNDLSSQAYINLVKVKWCVAKYGDPYSEFVLCIQPIQVHTHSSEHTHTVNTHLEQWAVILLWRPESSWWFGALLKGLTSWKFRLFKFWGDKKKEWIYIIVEWLCPQTAKTFYVQMKIFLIQCLF